MIAGKIEYIPAKKKARTPCERPGGESGGIFHFEREAVRGLSAFSVHVQPPRPSRPAKPDGQ